MKYDFIPAVDTATLSFAMNDRTNESSDPDKMSVIFSNLRA